MAEPRQEKPIEKSMMFHRSHSVLVPRGCVAHSVLGASWRLPGQDHNFLIQQDVLRKRLVLWAGGSCHSCSKENSIQRLHRNIWRNMLNAAQEEPFFRSLACEGEGVAFIQGLSFALFLVQRKHSIRSVPRCIISRPAAVLHHLMAYQLDPFDVGQIKAHMEHGLGCTSIARRLCKFKADGKSKTTFSETAVRNAMNKLEENPKWRGDREEGSGAPRKTTAKQDRTIVKWALDNRGKIKVNVAALKKHFPFLRQFNDSLVEERLHDADLEYLRRRKKSLVAACHLRQRVKYCHGVKRKHEATLLKWAYTDGTVYYLDRSEAEHANTVRRALGSHVWRKSDNSDAMYEECIGPSAYNKGQGMPVRVWGMLAGGKINIHILEEGEVMDTLLYVELIEDMFPLWRANCEHLVCDFESCIRSSQAVRALQKIDLPLVDDYPPVSQDFNAIENAWAILKERLDETVPISLESRDDFIIRLRAAVQWANRTRSDQLEYYSTNQKERAVACLKSKPPGGRTKW